MYAQVTFFDGPRSAELVQANERAGRERITPAVEADPALRDELVSLHVLRGPDGAELVMGITRTRAGLDRVQEVLGATELLPGEDPALLPGPDRVEIYEVVETRDWTAVRS
jgi:hypothetical protein